MSKKEEKDKNKLEDQDILEEMQEEIEELENEQGEIEEEKIEESKGANPEAEKLRDALLRVQADFDNFKKRSERDRQDMIFFLKSDIFKKILPRLDDLERIIKNTPEDMKSGALYEGIVSLEKSFKKDLDSMGISAFESIGKEADPHKHDVMTQISGEENMIVDEFEKGYELEGRVLRHAKVVVGNGGES